MQTFLPYADFSASAKVLDRKRLGKQRVETIQVIRALTRENYGWRHHPAASMWQGYQEALGRYGLTIVDAWTALGFADTCAATIRADLADAGTRLIRSQADLAAADALPPWLGDEAFHRSHRSALVRKDPAYYRAVFPDVHDDLEYVWPGGQIVLGMSDSAVGSWRQSQRLHPVSVPDSSRIGLNGRRGG